MPLTSCMLMLVLVCAVCKDLIAHECCVLVDGPKPKGANKDTESAAKLKELKQRIKELEQALIIAETKNTTQMEAKSFEVQAAKFQTIIEMQKAVDAAYEKGYVRCKEAMESHMSLLKSMRE